ncbi:hypothetical protein BGZ68_002995 [Mortierella alpina]|nr:hypothetical protein BGZ68_002995 [Mortierella alpina]
MAAEVFAMPELAEIVAQYLPPRDIAACRLTSRAFNNTFNPYLWKHISVFKPAYKSLLGRTLHRIRASASLYRNRQYVETLNLEIFAAECLQSLIKDASADDVVTTPSGPAQEPAGTPPHPAFSSLKSLSITVGVINNNSRMGKNDAVIPDGSLKTLLDEAPNITSLTLYPEVLESAKFIATLQSGLPHMKTLILTHSPELYDASFPVNPVLSALPLLFAKPKLTTLKLDFSLLDECEAFTAVDIEAMKDLVENPRAKSAITSMVFPHMSNSLNLAFVKPILESCLPQLQVLNVPSLGAQDLDQLIDLMPAHCPHVRELDLTRLYWSTGGFGVLFEQVIRVIKACKDLRVYHGPAYQESEYCRAITQALLQHASTLESLVFTEAMSSFAFASLISSMPALRTLIFRAFYVDVEGAISVRWASRHLERLEMTIKVEDTIVDYVKRQKLDLDSELNPGLPSKGLNAEALSNVAMRKLFKNIGELTELEELYVNHYYMRRWGSEKDWTLKVGLGFLGGLTKLRKLRLDYGVQHMGQTEIEFIHEHWPNLEEIYFYVGSKSLNKCKRTWEWLESRRPDLKLTFEVNIFADQVITF